MRYLARAVGAAAPMDDAVTERLSSLAYRSTKWRDARADAI
jgi:hypothetical protein